MSRKFRFNRRYVVTDSMRERQAVFEVAYAAAPRITCAYCGVTWVYIENQYPYGNHECMSADLRLAIDELRRKVDGTPQATLHPDRD